MKLLYFAQVAVFAGHREETWDVNRAVTQDELWAEIARRHPKVATLRKCCRVAAGGRYLDNEDLVLPDQECAILPPVSGG